MKQFSNLTIFNFKLLLFLTLTLFVGLTFSQTKAYAAGSLDVNWGVPNNSPVFSLNNMAPGQSTNKTITVTNNTGSALTVGIQGILTNQTGNIADVIHLRVANGSTVLYGDKTSKTLTQFFADSSNGQFVPLTTLSNSESVTYTVTATFDESADNQYQGKNVTFSLAIGSDMASISPTITPTLTPTPTITPPPTRRPLTLQQLLTAIFKEQQNLFRLIFGNLFH